MFSAKTTIGHNHQKRFGRNAKKLIASKASQEKLSNQEKLPEATVRYNPFEKNYRLVRYTCPHCEQMFWLEYSDGHRNIMCPVCKKRVHS